MARQCIEQLRRPPGRFRLPKRMKRGRGKFETRAEALARDRKRVEVLFKAMGSGELNNAEHNDANALIHHLRTPPRKRGRLSAASRVDMRKWRKRVTGELRRLLDLLDHKEWRAFTIVLPTWFVPSDELAQHQAARLMKRLRSALNRAGAQHADGWLFAMLHGEFDGTTGGFPLHVHGLATKGMFKLLARELRKQRLYKHRKGDRARYPMMAVKRRVLLQRPHGCRLAPITYAVKSYWPQHNSFIDAKGKRRRIGTKHEIASPVHKARYLMWLHSQPIKDQVLLMSMSVENGRLIHKRRGGRPRQT